MGKISIAGAGFSGLANPSGIIEMTAKKIVLSLTEDSLSQGFGEV